MATLPDGTEAQVLAESNGYQVLRNGDRILFVDRGWGWVRTARFVLGLVAALAVAGSVVVLTQVDAPTAYLSLCGVALVAVMGAYLVGRWQVGRVTSAMNAREILLVADTSGGKLLDAHGRELAALGELSVRRKMQIGSSSAALKAVWPGGEMVIARGSPFGGDVGPIEHALRKTGLTTG